jgi:hypothetical protein
MAQGWQRLDSLGDREAVWRPLGSQAAAAIGEQLRPFVRLACCDYLCPHMQLFSDWSDGGGSGDEEEDAGRAGIVIIDAQGGPVTVTQRSWKQMMESKLGRE